MSDTLKRAAARVRELEATLTVYRMDLSRTEREIVQVTEDLEEAEVVHRALRDYHANRLDNYWAEWATRF